MAPSKHLALLTLVPLSLANINFTWVQPTCSPTDEYNKCLKGQTCIGTTCVPDFQSKFNLFRVPEKRFLLRVRQAPRVDGRCGPSYDNSPCPAGQCCSAHGWCGTDYTHCLIGNGCISGCTDGSPTTPVTIDGTCGSQNGGKICGNWSSGSCCSPHGWCGISPAHCGSGCQSGPCLSKSASIPSISSGVQITSDGTCGSQNARTVCGDWVEGGCCSEHGWCGNSSAHCGTGCQSGCQNSSSSSSILRFSHSLDSSSDTQAVSLFRAASPEPSSEPKLSLNATPTFSSDTASATFTQVTKDGTCGARHGITICRDWSEGNCCSMFGYCGNDSAHCGPGCQSGNCSGPPVVPAPGPRQAPVNSNPGSFAIIGQAGIPPMHAGLLPNGRVAFFDKVENYTQLKLPNGYYAYSSEYDPLTNTVAPLAFKTNAFCAGGMPLADGRLMSVGGNGPLEFIDPTVTDGFKGIRYLTRSSTDSSYNGQDWSEPGNQLSSARWYPSVQIMPDGTHFVASGSLNGLDPNDPANNNPTYEILDRNGVSSGTSVRMSILVNSQPYYMYPFIHLLNDGNLFVFVAKSSQIFNVGSSTVLKSFADMPGDYRTYPNTGGSVLLPLSNTNNYAPDILICGGGPYQDISAPTDASCGRIQPYSTNPTWELDAMPEGRCMVEGNLLLDGTVLFLNGVNQGAQGFGEAINPTLDALIYDPNLPLGSRWSTAGRSTIGRSYHSVSIMMLDGTIMVAGSNPVEQPVLQPSAQNAYVTEFRVERYTPPYLSGPKAELRPTNVGLGDPPDSASSNTTLSISPGGPTFNVHFDLPNKGVQDVKVVFYYTGFVTHSVHMGHRMLYCDFTGFAAGSITQTLTVTPPPNYNITPPGYYVFFIVADGVPSIGQFVLVK